MCRILIVEDDDGLRAAVGRMIGVIGQAMAVDTVTSALEILDAIAVDLVVTDYQLGGSNGLALAGAVRERWPWIPVVLMSGDLDADLERRAIGLGVVACVLKPFALTTFMEAVAEALPPAQRQG